jgi:hypothetical protein
MKTLRFFLCIIFVFNIPTFVGLLTLQHKFIEYTKLQIEIDNLIVENLVLINKKCLGNTNNDS